MKNVILIFGGRSGEHEVSLRSAASIYEGLDKNKYNVFPLAIGKSGSWFGPVKPEDIASFKEEDYLDQEVIALPKPGGKIYSLPDFKEVFEANLAFPIIHGTYGEDGSLQGLLEYMDIAYVGAGVCGSAAGMDKIIMKDIFKAHDIPQVKYLGFDYKDLKERPQELINELKDKLKFPLFVKPANLGSSVGISKAKDEKELLLALKEAAKFDRRIILEEGHEVREIEASILGNEEAKISLLGEVIPASEFYDYHSKYIDDRSLTRLADDLSDSQKKEIEDLAIRAYKALDLSGFSRIDFFIDKNTGQVLLNEINSLPGFTSISMYPKLWEYSGLPLSNLLDELLGLALERYELKSKMQREK